MFGASADFSGQSKLYSLATKKVDAIKTQIAAIVPTQICENDKEIIIIHNFYLTMIDGKIFSLLAGSSTIINDLKAVEKLQPNESLIEYGLSTLHAWIRFFERILHIANKLDIKKWHVRGDFDKAAQK